MSADRRNASRAIRWLRQVDIAILVVAAFSGIFFGLADVLFDLPKVRDRQLGLAVALLGAVALHAIFQRVASLESHDLLDQIRSRLDSLISLDRARRSFVRAMGHFIEIQDLKFKLTDAKNEAYGNIADRLLAPSFRVLEHLAEGQVNVPENLVVPAFTMMLEAYRFRYDAVSNDDINFWHDNKIIAPRYLSQNIAALRRGLIVTRLFVVHERQILDDVERDRLVAVLTYQQFVGIAWALAIYEDLEPSLPPGPLDFALFDSDRAVSTFRREGERRFIANFNTSGIIRSNDERILDLRKLYESLLSEIWMVSETFADKFLGKSDELVARLRTETDLYNRRLPTSPPA